MEQAELCGQEFIYSSNDSLTQEPQPYQTIEDDLQLCLQQDKLADRSVVVDNVDELRDQLKRDQ